MYDDLVKQLIELPHLLFVQLGGYENIVYQAADAIEELNYKYKKALGDLVKGSKPKWIPVTARPMDSEERLEWSEKLGYDIEYKEAIIYTSQLPDDGEEVLTCDRYGAVRIDTFRNDPDYGCYFEDNGDMDGIVAWMPRPAPQKEES